MEGLAEIPLRMLGKRTRIAAAQSAPSSAHAHLVIDDEDNRDAMISEAQFFVAHTLTENHDNESTDSGR
jgi:hypothetical protein